MVRSASQYGVQRELGGTRSLAYDQYAELSRQTKTAQDTLLVNVIQAQLMTQMRDSLCSITLIMDQVRQQQADALAVQQELLKRDQVQSYLEEFIYNAEKLVAECSKADCTIPLSSRYFMLTGVVETVNQEGIGTPLIRGRDNKAAFETALTHIQTMIQSLLKNTEVQEAISWAETEQAKRLAIENEQEVRRSQLRRQIAELEQKVSDFTVASVLWGYLKRPFEPIRRATSELFAKFVELPMVWKIGVGAIALLLSPLLFAVALTIFPFLVAPMFIIAPIAFFFGYIQWKLASDRMKREVASEISVIEKELRQLDSN